MINKKGSALMWGIIVIVIAIVIVALFLLIGGGVKTVAEIKNDDYIGDSVKVSGKVDSSVKLGTLSGYTLRDKNEDRIFISTSTLPKEGSSVTVKGILRKNILGYYIEAE